MKTRCVPAALLFNVLLPDVSMAGFVSGQSADMALGGISAAGLIQTPEDIAVDPATQKVLIADATLHRVLRFSSAGSACHRRHGRLRPEKREITASAGSGFPRLPRYLYGWRGR